jgi:hypothetical protein
LDEKGRWKSKNSNNANLAGNCPFRDEQFAPFSFCRLHGIFPLEMGQMGEGANGGGDTNWPMEEGMCTFAGQPVGVIPNQPNTQSKFSKLTRLFISTWENAVAVPFGQIKKYKILENFNKMKGKDGRMGNFTWERQNGTSKNGGQKGGIWDKTKNDLLRGYHFG